MFMLVAIFGFLRGNKKHAHLSSATVVFCCSVAKKADQDPPRPTRCCLRAVQPLSAVQQAVASVGELHHPLLPQRLTHAPRRRRRRLVSIPEKKAAASVEVSPWLREKDVCSKSTAVKVRAQVGPLLWAVASNEGAPQLRPRPGPEACNQWREHTEDERLQH